MLVTSDKGIKIHLHSTDVVEPALQVLQDMKDQIKQPVFLHADLFEGPNMPKDAKLVDKLRFKVS